MINKCPFCDSTLSRLLTPDKIDLTGTPKKIWITWNCICDECDNTFSRELSYSLDEAKNPIDEED